MHCITCLAKTNNFSIFDRRFVPIPLKKTWIFLHILYFVFLEILSFMFMLLPILHMIILYIYLLHVHLPYFLNLNHGIDYFEIIRNEINMIYSFTSIIRLDVFVIVTDNYGSPLLCRKLFSQNSFACKCSIRTNMVAMRVVSP